jgi:GR25 family glycosyltransferase involved in LPS biosynthesis
MLINILMIIDKIYVINLKKRKDRLLKINMLFKELGGIFNNYERIEAVDGNNLSIIENNNLTLKTKYLFNNPTLFMDIKSKGAIGCYYSHLKIWKDAIKNNYNNIIIFEDDVYTDMSLNEIMDYINNLPSDYDIAYLDYFCFNLNNNNYVNNYWNENKLDTIALTSSYMLSLKGIKKLLMNAHIIEMQIDCYLSVYANINNNFKRYLAYKKIFNQGILGLLGFNTDITNLNWLNCIKCFFNQFILTKNFCKILIILIILFWLL